MGRPRQFNEADVLKRATGLFRRFGYRGTSIQDLVDSLGINRASMYLAFESKDGLFLKVLAAERERQAAAVNRILGRAPTAPKALEQLFAWAVEDALAEKGCLIALAAAELEPESGPVSDAVREASKAYQTLFRNLVEEGMESGELDRRIDAGAAALWLTAGWFGLRSMARDRAPAKLMEKSAFLAIRALYVL